MSRLKKASAILDAARRWKQQCLLDGTSLFGEEKLWTRENFEMLKEFFVERPEAGSGSFEEKLRVQLEPAPPEAKHLWAEIAWLYYLIVHSDSVGRVTKLDRIRTVYEWSGTTLPENHWALGDVLERGIVNPGTAYLAHQWREFRFIVLLMLNWSSLPKEERESSLNDPWGLAEWIDERTEGQRQFRHALLFLLFPDEFEPIMSPGHKRKIAKAFSDDTSKVSDFDSADLISLDKALLTVHTQLQDEYPEEEIHFYKAPFREIWKGDSTTSGNDSLERTDDEAWYRDRIGTGNTWVIAPGEGARLWGEFLKLGIAAIAWDDLGDLSEYESRDAIHDALIESGAGENPSNHSLTLWEFVHEMKIGDVVLAKKGRRAILGWGKVTGEYEHDSERAEYRNFRTIEWHPCPEPITLEWQIATKTLTRFTRYMSTLRDIFELIDADAVPSAKGSDETENQSYDVDTALNDLFLEETQFHRILDSIALRKNLILQGPPGVGKTYIARRIAWCLMKRKDPQSIEMVQFHQSYAYEDFVQGWRPTETGGFKLCNGVFYEFCKRAEKCPKEPYVFIIDEINRGNLSKILGELLMLIEADKRGPEHAISLAYNVSGDPFSVPDNVYLLGLMNTADRSLAMVDYALRRRFAFEKIEPAYRKGKFREYLLEAGIEHDLVDRIDKNLFDLNQHIHDDKDLGPGFQIGHSYFVPEEEAEADEGWYQNIIDTQIEPLLNEYWFDRPEQVKELVLKLKNE